VFQVVGIGQDVARIEAQDLSEVIDTRDVVVTNARLNHMLPLATEPRTLIDARKRRRSYLKCCFKSLPVNDFVLCTSGRGCNVSIEPLGIEGISQSHLWPKRPSLPHDRHGKRRRKIQSAHQWIGAQAKRFHGTRLKLASLQAFRGTVK